MFRNLFKGMLMLTFMIFCYGCASKGLEVKSYIEDRPRVDQSLDGNQGYLVGTAPEPGERKKTRKIYVIEASKEAEMTPEEKAALAPEPERTKSSMETNRSSSSVKSSKQDNSYTTNVSPRITIPSFDDMPSANMNSSSKTVEYTVDKDDTLQKISKKFYNNYSKWTKIYEFNKEKIKNPNHIKPGTVLTIPLE